MREPCWSFNDSPSLFKYIVTLVEILDDRGTVDGNSDNYCCGNAESRVGRGSHLCSEVKPCLAFFSFCFLFSVIPTV